MSEEQLIRETARTALTEWLGQTVVSSSLHPDCCVGQVDADGSYRSQSGRDYRLDETIGTAEILAVRQLQIGTRSAADVHARVVSSSSTAHLWMVCLRIAGQWQVISAAVADNSGAVTPSDFAAVTQLVWDGYCAANRACDGAAMAEVFHATCRLTWSGGDELGLRDCPSFCGKVTTRYEHEAPHIPYRHLKDDPRSRQGDSLVSIEFATPSLALVVLQVGHAPFLWTDLLTCAKIQDRWWIVHKSSCNEPFLVEEARE